jgi:hypothetical protein
MNGRSATAVIGLAGVVGALAVAGCGGGSDSGHSSAIPQPSEGQMAAAGLGKLPVAPDSQRIDLSAPPFSHPTEVTNPLFPIKELHSAVLNGRIDGKPFHTETTLLPYTRAIEWAPGKSAETLVSQYSAFLDGRLQEVALDYYAQADDGSVWYFGEDVADYNPQGQITYTTDSWLAGRDGPPAMIMPADPKVGQAFRTENIPGVVFEEVTVRKTGETVPGPTGPVAGTMVGSELHDDALRSNKVFAPGYGEFMTKDTDGIEAMALAVPTDAASGPVPADLATIFTAAEQAYAAIRAKDSKGAQTAAGRASAAWGAYRAAGGLPPRLVPPMDRAIAALSASAGSSDEARAGTAAIDVAQAALDFELRYRQPAEIDLARFENWTRRLLVDASAGDLGGVSSDLATMEWVRDRFAGKVTPLDMTTIDAHVLALRDDVNNKDVGAVGPEAESLLHDLAGARVSGG